MSSKKSGLQRYFSLDERWIIINHRLFKWYKSVESGHLWFMNSESMEGIRESEYYD